MAQLTIYERGAVERARKILADSTANECAEAFASYLGLLEVMAAALLDVIDRMTADGDGGKGAA